MKRKNINLLVGDIAGSLVATIILLYLFFLCWLIR
jgi:hypothetical protein